MVKQHASCDPDVDKNPQAMRQRRETAEHPIGTMKMRMGATHFLTERLPKVATEMCPAGAGLQSHAGHEHHGNPIADRGDGCAALRPKPCPPAGSTGNRPAKGDQPIGDSGLLTASDPGDFYTARTHFSHPFRRRVASVRGTTLSHKSFRLTPGITCLPGISNSDRGPRQDPTPLLDDGISNLLAQIGMYGGPEYHAMGT